MFIDSGRGRVPTKGSDHPRPFTNNSTFCFCLLSYTPAVSITLCACAAVRYYCKPTQPCPWGFTLHSDYVLLRAFVPRSTGHGPREICASVLCSFLPRCEPALMCYSSCGSEDSVSSFPYVTARTSSISVSRFNNTGAVIWEYEPRTHNSIRESITSLRVN